MAPTATELRRPDVDRSKVSLTAALAGSTFRPRKHDAGHPPRVILRDMLGDIRLQPATNGSLWTEYGMSPAVLLKGAGTGGRGEGISRFPAVSLDLEETPAKFVRPGREKSCTNCTRRKPGAAANDRGGPEAITPQARPCADDASQATARMLDVLRFSSMPK
jgi:hypothetical protein